MKVFNESLMWRSTDRTELVDITKMVRATVERLAVRSGIVLVNTLHTTCSLFINEFQAALVDDIKLLLENLVPDRGGYRHNDARYSDCERGNAAAHLRAALVGHSVAVGVTDGDLELGRFQSIILMELDGPRSRQVEIKVVGE